METIVIEIENGGTKSIYNFQFRNRSGDYWEAKLLDDSKKTVKDFNCSVIPDCLDALSDILLKFGNIRRIFALKPDCNHVSLLKNLIAGKTRGA